MVPNLREILTFRRNVEKLRIGAKRRTLCAPSLALSSACCTQQRSLPNDGVRRYEDSHRPGTLHYNAYLLALLLQVRQLYVKEAAAADAVLDHSPDPCDPRESQGDDRSANAFPCASTYQIFFVVLAVSQRICQSASSHFLRVNEEELGLLPPSRRTTRSSSLK
jgi:hypothetical protein